MVETYSWYSYVPLKDISLNIEFFNDNSYNIRTILQFQKSLRADISNANMVLFNNSYDTTNWKQIWSNQNSNISNIDYLSKYNNYFIYAIDNSGWFSNISK